MKKIAITMGEPGGVGPEIVVKALNNREVRDICLPVLMGDVSVFEDAIGMTGIPLKLTCIDDAALPDMDKDRLYIVHTGPSSDYRKGSPSRDGGMAAVRAIKRAVLMAKEGRVDGIVTAPISKESLKLAGLPWRGHTDMLAELTHTDEYAMMFVGDKLCIILVTIHIPLREVHTSIDTVSVLRTIRLARKGMGLLGVRDPRIGIAGLNPTRVSQGYSGMRR